MARSTPTHITFTGYRSADKTKSAETVTLPTDSFALFEDKEGWGVKPFHMTAYFRITVQEYDRIIIALNPER